MEATKQTRKEEIEQNTKQTSKQSSSETILHITVTGMFTALICVLAILAIPVQPVPFTLALFAIFLTGALLKPKYAFLSVLCYLLIGAIGIPVYAGFKSGVGVLFSMTGGYLLSYPIMAWMIAMSIKLFHKRNLLSLGIGMLLALFTCYFIGTLWFAYITGSTITYSLAACVYPFVAFDLLKAVFAGLFSLLILKTPVRQYLN